jgi:hypothetical protein
MYAEAEITKLDMPMEAPIASAVGLTLRPGKTTIYPHYRIESWNQEGQRPHSYTANIADYLNATSLKKLADSGITRLQVKDMQSHSTLLTISMLTAIS